MFLDVQVEDELFVDILTSPVEEVQKAPFVTRFSGDVIIGEYPALIFGKPAFLRVPAALLPWMNLSIKFGKPNVPAETLRPYVPPSISNKAA